MCGIKHGLTFGQNGSTGFDSYPTQSCLRRLRYRDRANDRRIYPHLLTSLGEFHQDTTGSVAAEFASTCQQRIGPLHRLNSQYHPLLDDDRLPDIHRG